MIDDIYPVRLLILDSIAAPTRRDFGGSVQSAPQRVSAVLQLAQALKRLADQLQLVVIVINQVGINDNDSMPDSIVQTRKGSDLVAVHAALGTAWTHCLSTRLLLQHERDPHCLANTAMEDAHENISPNATSNANVAWKEERGRIRKATVVKSNVAGMESMHYEINMTGLEEICFANDE